MDELRTERLLLRRWRAADAEPFAAMNADPEVTRYLPARLDRAESDALIARMEHEFDERGHGLWAVEVVGTGQFIGFTGLDRAEFSAPFTPAVEVGWRLRRSAWGHGYATEAGRASLRHGFEDLGLAEIYSFTSAINLRSEAVMERLGMTRVRSGDFEHPTVPEGSPLRPHVLYRMTSGEWQTHTGG